MFSLINSLKIKMKNITPIISGLLFMMIVLAACETDHSKNNNLQINTNAGVLTNEAQDQVDDAAALSDAYNKSMFEKALADSVKNRSDNTEVKELAETMIEGHATINTEIKTLADKKNIALPHELTAAQEIKIAGIKSKSGNELAKDYAANLVNDHNEVIRTYQQQVAVCKDPDIKEWFQNSLRLLNSHLDMANLYKRKLENKR
jgi:putative membrane protein